MRRLILLTEPEFHGPLAAPFAAAAPDLQIVQAATLPALEALLADARRPTRLLSVGGAFIVPARILEQLSGPAYNLHPGPPEYPGLFPSVFALYEGATSFGITLHEMAPLVDSGLIVAVDRIPIMPTWDRLALDTTTFQAMRAMLARMAAPLVDIGRPLPRMPASWAGRMRTRRDFAELCALPIDVSEAEFARRLRAVGEGPEHALGVTKFGRRFALVSEASPVVRAGAPLRK